MKHRFAILVGICTLILVAGCGNPKVTGTVTYPDGSPLQAGNIYFESETFSASGFINPDGSYSLGGVKTNDGVPPGKYKVFITGAIKTDFSADSGARADSTGLYRTPGVLAPTMRLLDTKYESPTSSGLEVEVTKSMVHNITVEKPAALR